MLARPMPASPPAVPVSWHVLAWARRLGERWRARNVELTGKRPRFALRFAPSPPCLPKHRILRPRTRARRPRPTRLRPMHRRSMHRRRRLRRLRTRTGPLRKLRSWTARPTGARRIPRRARMGRMRAQRPRRGRRARSGAAVAAARRAALLPKARLRSKARKAWRPQRRARRAFVSSRSSTRRKSPSASDRASRASVPRSASATSCSAR
jgi:hypothetical protein